VAEALRGRRPAYRLLVATGIQVDTRIRDILDTAQRLAISVDDVPRELLDDSSRGANHQGVGLDAGAYEYVALEDFSGRDGTVLVLDHVQDPQNFGTLLRAAEAVAVAGVVIPQDRAVAVTPAVVNASSGAVEHLQVARVPNISRALDAFKEAGRWVIGLDESATSKPLYSTDLPTPTALVVGAEAKGISANVAKKCDLLVSLPMRGKVASLNAATAGSIVLFDLQRRSDSE
jgi:23S rRNA (guanosine2251-2'-O)-methyltransferase